MFETGIVSVTFRSLPVKEIVSLTKKASLSVIEWGGDIHVPSGNTEAAKEAVISMNENGIHCRTYGSYYKLRENEDFSGVLDTAEALSASSVRIWAGVRSSAATDASSRKEIISRLRRDAKAAKERGIAISFEYHGGTLTDSADSALLLLEECGEDNCMLHWQPNQYRDLDYNLRELERVSPFVDTAHVFAWEGEAHLPLCSHTDAWRRYIDLLVKGGRCKDLLLEFLPCETEEDLMRDASLLNLLVK